MAYRILVTGGAGFIGSHTVDALIQKGHRVRILDNLTGKIHPEGRPEYLNNKAQLMIGDVRDKQIWEAALKDIDVVYHLAAYQDYLTDFSTFFYVNCVSTALLYEVLVEHCKTMEVKKVIVAASQAVMGEGRHYCKACNPGGGRFQYPPIRSESKLAQGDWNHRCPACGSVLQWVPSDETVIHPCNPYALSKHSQEQIAINLGNRYDIPTVVLRYSIVQGDRQSFSNAYSGAMRIFSLCLLFNQSPTLFEDGNQIRDFINIQDAVDANLVVLENQAANGCIFNVGGGIPWTILKFFGKMQAVLKKDIEPQIPGHYRFGDTRHIVSDTSRLQALGWTPRRNIEESIDAYWTYITSRKVKKEVLDHATRQMRQMQVIRNTRPSQEA